MRSAHLLRFFPQNRRNQGILFVEFEGSLNSSDVAGNSFRYERSGDESTEETTDSLKSGGVGLDGQAISTREDNKSRRLNHAKTKILWFTRAVEWILLTGLR
jgi:hypothetical protein